MKCRDSVVIDSVEQELGSGAQQSAPAGPQVSKAHPSTRQRAAASPELGLELHPPEVFTRTVESALALSMLILTLPIMMCIAIVIKLDSPGPALFVQKRLGLGGRVFRFVKFRTLYADAKTRFPHLYAYKYSSEELKGLRFKVENDPRVTRVGQWLRKSSLDELPNLWNVVTGDMALVGPRPEIPEMLPYYQGEMLKKFTVRPGVTGLAQTSGRGRLGFYETVDLDVEYVHLRCALLDIRLLLRTVRMVVLRDGAF